MPNLNCKTRRLMYTAVDQRCIEAAIRLLGTMAEYDSSMANIAGHGMGPLEDLLRHVKSERAGKPTEKQPTK